MLITPEAAFILLLVTAVSLFAPQKGWVKSFATLFQQKPNIFKDIFWNEYGLILLNENNNGLIIPWISISSASYNKKLVFTAINDVIGHKKSQ